MSRPPRPETFESGRPQRYFWMGLLFGILLSGGLFLIIFLAYIITI